MIISHRSIWDENYRTFSSVIVLIVLLKVKSHTDEKEWNMKPHNEINGRSPFYMDRGIRQHSHSSQNQLLTYGACILTIFGTSHTVNAMWVNTLDPQDNDIMTTLTSWWHHKNPDPSNYAFLNNNKQKKSFGAMLAWNLFQLRQGHHMIGLFFPVKQTQKVPSPKD